MKKIITTLTAAILLLASCDDTTCGNTNTLFNQSNYNDPVYKRTLADSLAIIREDELQYTLSGFLEQNGKEYITVQIRHGKDFCAMAQLLLNEEEGFSEIRKKKGMGYRGAVLEGLQVKTVRETDSVFFEAVHLHKVID